MTSEQKKTCGRGGMVQILEKGQEGRKRWFCFGYARFEAFVRLTSAGFPKALKWMGLGLRSEVGAWWGSWQKDGFRENTCPWGELLDWLRRLVVSGGPIGKGGAYEEESRGWEENLEGAPRPGREWGAGSEAAKRSSWVDWKSPTRCTCVRVTGDLTDVGELGAVWCRLGQMDPQVVRSEHSKLVQFDWTGDESVVLVGEWSQGRVYSYFLIWKSLEHA